MQDNLIFPQPRTTRSFKLQAFSIVRILTSLQNIRQNRKVSMLTIHIHQTLFGYMQTKSKELSVYEKTEKLIFMTIFRLSQNTPLISWKSRVLPLESVACTRHKSPLNFWNIL